MSSVQLDPGGYRVIVSREVHDGEVFWVADVPELPGCYCADLTEEEAVQHIRLAIQDWLDEAKESNRPIPSPLEDASGRFTLRVPRSLHRILRNQAEVEHVSLNQYVTSILTYWAGHRTAASHPTTITYAAQFVLQPSHETPPTVPKHLPSRGREVYGSTGGKTLWTQGTSQNSREGHGE